jgi:hypothetical protein
MPLSKTAPKSKLAKSTSTPPAAQLDIVFGGPLLFVPAISNGNVTGLDVYAPSNGHPIGAVFVPGVWFSDAELDDPRCERWPEPESFSLLDPHSYSIDLTQQLPAKAGSRTFPVAAIPDTNHKVRPGRKLGSNWDVAASVNGKLSAWSSHRLHHFKDGEYRGSDAPTTSTAALLHRLTYTGVVGAEFWGAPTEAKEYLSANISKGGTLIVEGEVPYRASQMHERHATDALAKLAGLDLHLAMQELRPHPTHLMNHTGTLCIHSVIVA